MMDDADREVRQASQTLGEQAHDDTLAGTGVAMDQGEAALAQVRLFDAPAEVLDLRWYIERLGGYLRGEGVPFQAIQGQQLLVHTASSFRRSG